MSEHPSISPIRLRSRSRSLATLLAAAGVVFACAEPPADSATTMEAAELPAVDLSGGPAFPLDAHLEQADVIGGSMTTAEIFEAGAEIFHAPMNGHDGVGAARLPDGTAINRFTPVPAGGGVGTPLSSQSCGSCHNFPFDAAAGLATTNFAGDPNNDGAPPFNMRSTISLFGDGMIQLLAIEITEGLHAIRDEAAAAAAESPGEAVERALQVKGIDYGTIAATSDGSGDVTFDLSGVAGVDPDLVIRPFGFKGSFTSLRLIAVGASANLMGMQAEELVWRLPLPEPTSDPDGDGVGRELSVGDITAMVMYNAGQEIPQSVQYLADNGFVAAPSASDVADIDRGEETFASIGCASCHIPALRVENPVFEEPTDRAGGAYLDPFLLSRDVGYDPATPVRMDLMTEAEEPRAEPHPDGGALLRSYSDLKRHRMGRVLADPGGPQPPLTPALAPLQIDGEIVLIGPDEFLTPELWGVGNTGPWLHDGRAGTLEEAILLHGEDDPPAVGDPGRSEAQEARDAFAALAAEEREAVLKFLRNLRTFAHR